MAPTITLLLSPSRRRHASAWKTAEKTEQRTREEEMAIHWARAGHIDGPCTRFEACSETHASAEHRHSCRRVLARGRVESLLVRAGEPHPTLALVQADPRARHTFLRVYGAARRDEWQHVGFRQQRRPAWVSTNGMEHNELTDQGSMYTCHGTSVTVLFSHVPFHFSRFTCAKAPYRQYFDVTVDASLQRRSLAPQFAPSRPSRAHRWWWPASSTRSQRNLQRFER